MKTNSSTDSFAAFLGLCAFLFMFGMLGYFAGHIGKGIYLKIQHKAAPLHESGN